MQISFWMGTRIYVNIRLSPEVDSGRVTVYSIKYDDARPSCATNIRVYFSSGAMKNR